jgi:dCTP deaminase
VSILTKREILKQIEKGRIKIQPFDTSKVGPGSVDLHLGNEFRIFKKVHNVIHISERTSHEQVTEMVKVKKYFVLMPGETILGITKEKITLPSDICGWLEGRSRFARLGLLVHISASFMHPGIANQQVLEISNFSPMPLAIYPGTPICQFIFQKTIGKAKYSGKHRTQSGKNF